MTTKSAIKQNTQTKPQLRISSGTLKNKKLEVPEIPGMRPVQEIAKQAIFSILADKIIDANCADLFAGSGNMGIEALSRGANSCDFVDLDLRAVNTIEKNLFNCDLTEKSDIFHQQATKFAIEAAKNNKKYDAIFIDPFYEDTAQVFLLKQIPSILEDRGLAIILYGNKLDLETAIKDTGLEIVTTRKFGVSHFSVLQKSQKTA